MSSNRTKVLLWHWGHRGGGPRYTLELARALAKRPDIELHLSLSRQSEILPEFMKLELPGFHINTYTGKISALAGSARLFSLRALFARYLKEHKIQVVNCSMTTLWNLAIVPLIRRAGAKYLLTLHDAVLHSGEDQWMRRWLTKKEVAEADYIVTLTEFVRSQLLGVYKFPKEKTDVIPHGSFMNGSSSKMARSYPHNRNFRLLFFGRILPYKGLDLLLQAFRILKTDFPDIELTVAGRGKLGSYASGMRELGVHTDNRYIPEDEIMPIFAHADLAILPYTEASQSGVAPLAHAAGVPVVATPVGGLKEQVIDNVNGFLTKTISGEAIAESIAAIIRDPILYERFSRESCRYALEDLSWTPIGERFEEIYLRLTNGSKNNENR